MKTILFQGDSITDAGRDREIEEDLGKGYPNLVAARLGIDRPGEFRFFNRGVSGDRVVDVYARMKKDILNVRPDYMSLLVGVNDVWHELDFSNGVDAKRFERIYRMLLDDILSVLPDLKLMIFEPYVMKGWATERYFETFQAEVAKRAEIVKKLAGEFGLPFIPLREPLMELSQNADTSYYLQDGVHPKPPFHQYIADRWLEVFSQWEKTYPAVIDNQMSF